MANKISRIVVILIGVAILIFFIYSFTFSSEISYDKSSVIEIENITKKKTIKHLTTPEPLKSIYMTQCVAGTPSFREKLVKLVGETELNAIIIDIKDYTGTVSFETDNPTIDEVYGGGCKVSDMQDFVESLHEKNIYVIGRVTVFQDPAFVKMHPDLAVKRASDGGVWKDRKGISFIDVGAKPFWDYIVAIATSSYAIGFDEINFDYIRFPSDGNMKDISFTHTGAIAKKEMLKKFFEYLDQKLAGTGIVTSADLFGMTTTNTDDLNIGQVLEYALLNFDYVAPMVYPSHYPATFNGWPDPNKVPYEIIKFSMDSAVARVNFLKEEMASSTPDSSLLNRLGPKQLRPWLQDFDLGADYDAVMIRKEKQAVYDAGLNSWLMWSPSNRYTIDALDKL